MNNSGNSTRKTKWNYRCHMRILTVHAPHRWTYTEEFACVNFQFDKILCRCRSPPVFPSKKNDGSTEMIKKNDGISKDDICQNQFTAYVVLAVKRKRQSCIGIIIPVYRYNKVIPLHKSARYNIIGVNNYAG